MVDIHLSEQAKNINAMDQGERKNMGDWYEEGGFGWIDIGKTAVIPVDDQQVPWEV
jgi:hypothetical protein